MEGNVKKIIQKCLGVINLESEYVKKSIWGEASKPSYYSKDLEIAVYMSIGYQYSGLKVFGKSSTMAFRKIHHENEENLQDKYKRDITKYFPFKIIKYKKHSDDYEYRGCHWCWDFQEKLMETEKREVFSIKKKGTDITRYGYKKSMEIYNSLKDSKVENLLMLEIGLGFMLTNSIFGYVKDLKDTVDLEKLKPIIKRVSEMPCIRIRKKIAVFLFEYLRYFEFRDDKIDEVLEIITKEAEKIAECYKSLLKLKWCYWVRANRRKLECSDERKRYLKAKQKKLRIWWDDYYMNMNTPEERELISQKIDDMVKGDGKSNIKVRLVRGPVIQEDVLTEDLEREIVSNKFLLLIKHMQDPTNEKAKILKSLKLGDDPQKEAVLKRAKEKLQELKEREGTTIGLNKTIRVPQGKLDPEKIYAILHQNIVENILENFEKFTLG